MSKRVSHMAIAVSLMIAAGGAAAETARAQTQEQSENRNQVFPRSYFDQYGPQTARDMIDRLPGFQLDVGDDLRGFGGNAGNVLIDGERPSSKTGGIEDALSRIPADSVDRIELIRGSAGSSEATGQSIVANVIRSADRQSGNWQVQLERAAHGKYNINGELSFSKSFGDWSTSTKINGTLERRPVTGFRISREAQDILTRSQLEERPSDQRQIAISSEAKRAMAGGILTLNGRFSHRPDIFSTDRLVFDGRLPGGVPDQRVDIDFVRTIDDYEFGADWSRSIGDDWSLKLLSLSTYRDLNQQQFLVTQQPVGSEFSSSIFSADRNSFETIFRTTVGRSGSARVKPEFGGEVAYNKLDSGLALRVADASGISEIELPAANVVVEELRGEAFANLIYKAFDKITIETGLEAELSKISVSGDANSSQSYFFLKPSATLRYDVSPDLQFSMGARRSVGQLDFADFAASASAADDRLLAGNPELGPDQTTRVFLAADFRRGTGTSLNVEAFYEWRNDVLEQVILPSGQSGVANAGSARFWGFKANASLPLSGIIPGGLLEIETEFLDSSFTDPITGEKRSLSSIDSPNILVEFRQDLASDGFAWGVSYRAKTEGLFFFTDEESLNQDGEHWSVFLETTKLLGVKTNLEFSGVGSQKFFRGRRFFNPDRSGTFNGSESINTKRGMFVTLTLSKQF